MKFAVDFISKKSGRIGCLTKSNRIQLKTPVLFNYTKGASIPHISREVFDLITNEQQALEIPIENSHQMVEAVKQFKKGIASFVGFENAISFVTLKDPGASNPSFNTKSSVSILPRTGKIAVTSDLYMQYIDSYKPDIFHTLCDGDTSEDCSKKRLLNSTLRSEIFFKECVEHYQKSKHLADSMLIAPVEGGYSKESRIDFIKNLEEYSNDIGGYFLDGFHSNGETACDLKIDKVKEILSECLRLLPADKLKIMVGAYDPIVIIELIMMKIDVFDTSYVYLATSKMRAITFSCDPNDNKKSTFDINLADARMKEDFRPFVDGCSCLACKNHTRAYVYHLITTRELLAPILLMIHNTHHFHEFFKTIRELINIDLLPDLLEHLRRQKSIKNLNDDKCSDEINKINEVSKISSQQSSLVSNQIL